MGWNYRIMKIPVECDDNGCTYMYGLGEVHYDEDSIILAHSEKPITGWFENPKDLIDDLLLLLNAANSSKDFIEYNVWNIERDKKEKQAIEEGWLSRFKKENPL